jgi:NDP-sugar pyrophosphorylase family protein
MSFDLNEILQALIVHGKLRGVPINEPFFEIGSLDGISELQNLLPKVE